MPLTTLCRACQFCCDGTLFDVVVLAPGEAQACAGLSPRRREDGSQVVDQHCPALGPAGCGAYEGRPAQCRAYECLLFRALAEGDVSLAGALETVARARQLAGTPGHAAFLKFHFRGQRG